MLRITSLLVTVAALAGATAASATTGSGNQNPNLALTVSLSPETVAVGQTATATETVQNTTQSKQVVTLSNTLVRPNGTSSTRTQRLTLKPGQAFTQRDTYTRTAADAAGTYTLRAAATGTNGTSTATATVQYV